ncbi:GLUT4 regulating protein TUG-domain-containing protein [Pyrenochaeta sp. MPI-SDFR-AT-0127]|nr:GLUT4 regulating protein TUG-domain-containing protein [Pyrenochaeta sp. MPI-SDFR-AT-0127]
MSHVTVFNSSARSVRIATTPVKYLTEVRDEACQKLGVSKDQFTLKYNNKPISLSQQIRLANLPQGARLELVQASRSPTVISVALQLPKSRLTQKFASTTSLWEILRQFESGQGANYNFTQRGVPEMTGASGSGRLNYEMPVITVMPGHKEQSSFVELQQTLSQLGFDSGSALLKLSYKNSGIPLEEAMAQISRYFKVEEPAITGPEGAHMATSSQKTSVPDPSQAATEAKETVVGETIRNDELKPEPEPEPMEVETNSIAERILESEVSTQNSTTINLENISPSAARAAATSTAEGPQPETPISSSQPSQLPRNVQIFSAPTSSTPQAVRNAFNESDYLPTIEHAKSHQAALLNKTRNQRLLSDKELEEQEKERQAKINAAAEKGGALRIRMPDGTLIQMDLTKADTAHELYDFVKNFLERKNEPFKLNYTSPAGRLVLISQDNKRLIQDLRFFNNELITFQWADNASAEVRASRKTLSHEWQAKAQTLKIEEPAPSANQQAPKGQTVAEGKRKVSMSSEEKESKLKSLLGKGLFKKK